MIEIVKESLGVMSPANKCYTIALLLTVGLFLLPIPLLYYVFENIKFGVEIGAFDAEEYRTEFISL